MFLFFKSLQPFYTPKNALNALFVGKCVNSPFEPLYIYGK
jgi:hypothetical protein